MHTEILAENHFLFNIQNDIRNICNNMLNSVGITYFNYLRVYNDGTSYLLCTHNEMIKYVFENKIPVAAPVDSKLVSTNFNYFILPIGKYNKFVHHAKIYWNLANFIDLVDRHEEYIELYCFGSTATNSGIINFYLNNMDFLIQFKKYFKETAATLLKSGEKNKIALPNGMEPPYRGLNFQPIYNEKNIPLRKLDLDLKNRYRNVILTPREHDCLSQVAAGYTAKEAARNLGISHRTVENYLAHLKSKLDCHKKSELIRIYLENLH